MISTLVSKKQIPLGAFSLQLHYFLHFKELCFLDINTSQYPTLLQRHINYSTNKIN